MPAKKPLVLNVVDSEAKFLYKHRECFKHHFLRNIPYCTIIITQLIWKIILCTVLNYWVMSWILSEFRTFKQWRVLGFTKGVWNHKGMKKGKACLSKLDFNGWDPPTARHCINLSINAVSLGVFGLPGFLFPWVFHVIAWLNPNCLGILIFKMIYFI